MTNTATLSDDLEVVWGALKGYWAIRYGQDPVHIDEDELIIVFKEGDGFRILGYMHYLFGMADVRHLDELIGRMGTMAGSYFGPCGITLLCNAPFSTLTPRELSGLPRNVSYQQVISTGGGRSVRIEDVDLGEAAKECLRGLWRSDDSRYMVFMEGNVARVHLHSLEAERRDRIEALGDEPDVSRIQEIPDVDDPAKKHGDFHRTGMGTSPGDCRISVFDRDGGLVWESEEGFTISGAVGDGGFPFPLRTEDVLLYREDFQGLYKVYMLDAEGEFDPAKLSCNPVILCGRHRLIGELLYGEGDLLHVEDTGQQVRYWNTAAI